MWDMLALNLTIISVLLIYLTNKHQKLLRKTIATKWRMISWIGLCLALFSWLQNNTLSAALFLWVFFSSVVVIFIPFISLIITSDKNKPAIQGKNND